MVKLRVLSGNQVCKILGAHGFKSVRRRGSHIIMQKKLPTHAITVPVPNHKEITPGTLLSIIKESEIPRNEFE